MTLTPPDRPAGAWYFEAVEGNGSIAYVVYDGTSPEAICTMAKERNARRIVDSANATGYPDLAAFADDEANL